MNEYGNVLGRLICTVPGPCLLADKKSNTHKLFAFCIHHGHSMARMILVYVNFGSANLDPPTNMATSCIYS